MYGDFVSNCEIAVLLYTLYFAANRTPAARMRKHAPIIYRVSRVTGCGPVSAPSAMSAAVSGSCRAFSDCADPV